MPEAAALSSTRSGRLAPMMAEATRAALPSFAPRARPHWDQPFLLISRRRRSPRSRAASRLHPEENLAASSLLGYQTIARSAPGRCPPAEGFPGAARCGRLLGVVCERSSLPVERTVRNQIHAKVRRHSAWRNRVLNLPVATQLVTASGLALKVTPTASRAPVLVPRGSRSPFCEACS
jgi:hypothetical protein